LAAHDLDSAAKRQNGILQILQSREVLLERLLAVSTEAGAKLRWRSFPTPTRRQPDQKEILRMLMYSETIRVL